MWLDHGVVCSAMLAASLIASMFGSMAACDIETAEPPVTGSTGGSGGDTDPAGSSSGAAAGSTGNAPTTDETTSGSTGHPAPDFACEDRSECVLHSDCCTCQAMHVDEPVPACDQECSRPACEQWGITELLCSHTCLIRLVECNPDKVMCDEPPPSCDEGFRPTIEDRCYTGHCVPEHLCRPS